jgi:hypothetical protein
MRRMRKLLVAILVALAAHVAAAQEIVSDGHGPGVGVEQNLGGLTGASFVYDAPRFHIDVLLGIQHVSEDGPDFSNVGVAGRFFFIVHRLDRADFALGGGIGIARAEQGNVSETNIHIEAAAQIRAFITSNVALSASLGLVVVTADNNRLPDGPVIGQATGNDEFGFGGQLFGGFGVTYFFR